MNRRERRAAWHASHSVASPAISAIRGRPPASHAPPFSSIRMRIGELVLRGFEKRHASRIADTFKGALDKHLRDGASPGILRSPMRSSSLRLAPIALRRSSTPAAIGEQLAASVLAFEREARRRGGLR